MSKKINLREPKVNAGSSAKRSEFKTRLFAKSAFPKTIKEHIKLALNLFINLFG